MLYAGSLELFNPFLPDGNSSSHLIFLYKVFNCGIYQATDVVGSLELFKLVAGVGSLEVAGG